MVPSPTRPPASGSRRDRALVNGLFDLGLAAVLASLSLAQRVALWANRLDRPAGPGLPHAIGVDLVLCGAAVLAVRWPRTASLVMAAALVQLRFTSFTPFDVTIYAGLIPIVGTGLRGQKSARWWVTVTYVAVMAWLWWFEWQARPARYLFALGLLLVVIAILWAFGDLSTALRRAQVQAADAAWQAQRLAWARDLHDTVARELSRASLRAQMVAASAPGDDVNDVVAGIQRASQQLRWMLALLRDDPAGAGVSGSVSADGVRRPVKPDDGLRAVVASLEAHGFEPEVTVDGRLEDVPPSLVHTVLACLGEAGANIERHGEPGTACAIIIHTTDVAFDAVFFNTIRAGGATSPAGVGLTGLRERLAAVGGEIAGVPEGSQWMTRITIPLGIVASG